MSKLLPYFKWYPGDAEGDDFYSLLLSNEELGIYHRLLNRSWLNNGVTTDMDALAAFCHMSRKQFDKAWQKIGQRWEVSPNDPNKLVNPRQELERESAKAKSENNKREGNANAKGSRSERKANDPQRALAPAESVSGSPFRLFPFEGGVGGNRTQPAAISAVSTRFPEFWSRYPVKDGEAIARGVWETLVSPLDEDEVFACLENYLASDRCERSPKNAANWLHDAARDKWSSRWPARASPLPTKSAEAAMRIADNLRAMHPEVR